MDHTEAVAELARIARDNEKACLVEIDGDFGGPYPALVRTDMRWNGWACPRFTLDVVRVIAADTEKLLEKYGAEVVDVVKITEDGRVLMVQGQYDETELIGADDDGMYSVGSWYWTWTEHK